MNTFLLKIATPDGQKYADQATMLSLRGSEGSLAVLAGHIPFMTAVQAGECKIELPDGSVRLGETNGGLLTVTPESVTLLSDVFSWKET